MEYDFRVTLPAVRTNAGMSQSEWANALGVSLATVTSWEKGKTSPTLKVLRKMSKLSGLPIDVFSMPNQSDIIGLHKKEA